MAYGTTSWGICAREDHILVVPAPGIEPRTLGLRGTTAIYDVAPEFQSSELLITKSLLAPSAGSLEQPSL